MLLAIEQGNTNTLFAIHDGNEWTAQWRSSTESSRTADEYAVWLMQLVHLQGLTLDSFKACIISSVVPQSIFNLRNLSRRYLKVEPLVIGDNAELGVEVRIEKPSEAGADRLVNAVGGYMSYGGPLIIIDSGTATTFDVVGADGAFEGGVCILPLPSCRAWPSSVRSILSARIRSAPCRPGSFGAISD